MAGIVVNKYETINALIGTVIYWIMTFIIILLMPGNDATLLFYFTSVFLSLFFCTISGVCKGNEKSKERLFLLTIAFLILYFVLAFRNENAIDDWHYSFMFDSVSEGGWFKSFSHLMGEPAYLIILQVISFFTRDYFWVQIVTAVIPVIILLRSFYDYREDISCTVALYLLIMTFYFQMVSTNLSRMFFAIAIFFYAIRYLINDDLKKYIIAILIATLFHYSAIFMLLFAYFCSNKTPKKLITFILYIGIPILFYFVGRFVAPLMGQKYSMYTQIGTVDASTLISCLDTLPFLLILLFFSIYIKEADEKETLLTLLCIYGFSIIIQISSLLVELGRLNYYINMVFIYSAAYIYKKLPVPFLKTALLAVLIIYGFFYLYVTQFCLESHAKVLFPYQNILFGF